MSSSMPASLSKSDSEQRDVVGVIVYDRTCWSWPGMFAHLANDGRHDQQADRCNSQLQRHGHLHAIKAIPALDVSDPDWAASEILWDYTPRFWSGNSQSTPG